MRIRVGVILSDGDSLALIRRVKPNRRYFVIPGGGLEDAEYTTAGAVREAKEELGVDVDIQRLIAVVERVEANKVTHCSCTTTPQ